MSCRLSVVHYPIMSSSGNVSLHEPVPSLLTSSLNLTHAFGSTKVLLRVVTACDGACG